MSDAESTRSSSTSQEARRTKSIVDALPWLTELAAFNRTCLADLSGGRKIKILSGLDFLIDKLQNDSERCFVDTHLAARLSEKLRQLLYVYRYLYESFKFNIYKEYFQRISTILATYIDLELFASIRGREYDEAVVERTQLVLKMFLPSTNATDVLNVLIKVKRFDRQHHGILNQLLTHFLVDENVQQPKKVDDDDFIRYLIVFRRWFAIKELPEGKEAVRKAFRTQVAPKPTLRTNPKYMTNLPVYNRNPAFPASVDSHAYLLDYLFSLKPLMDALEQSNDIDAVVIADDEETNNNKTAPAKPSNNIDEDTHYEAIAPQPLAWLDDLTKQALKPTAFLVIDDLVEGNTDDCHTSGNCSPHFYGFNLQRALPSLRHDSDSEDEPPNTELIHKELGPGEDDTIQSEAEKLAFETKSNNREIDDDGSCDSVTTVDLPPVDVKCMPKPEKMQMNLTKDEANNAEKSDKPSAMEQNGAVNNDKTNHEVIKRESTHSEEENNIQTLLEKVTSVQTPLEEITADLKNEGAAVASKTVCGANMGACLLNDTVQKLQMQLHMSATDSEPSLEDESSDSQTDNSNNAPTNEWTIFGESTQNSQLFTGNAQSLLKAKSKKRLIPWNEESNSTNSEIESNEDTQTRSALNASNESSSSWVTIDTSEISEQSKSSSVIVEWNSADSSNTPSTSSNNQQSDQSDIEFGSSFKRQGLRGTSYRSSFKEIFSSPKENRSTPSPNRRKSETEERVLCKLGTEFVRCHSSALNDPKLMGNAVLSLDRLELAHEVIAEDVDEKLAKAPSQTDSRPVKLKRKSEKENDSSPLAKRASQQSPTRLNVSNEIARAHFESEMIRGYFIQSPDDTLKPMPGLVFHLWPVESNLKPLSDETQPQSTFSADLMNVERDKESERASCDQEAESEAQNSTFTTATTHQTTETCPPSDDGLCVENVTRTFDGFGDDSEGTVEKLNVQQKIDTIVEELTPGYIDSCEKSVNVLADEENTAPLESAESDTNIERSTTLDTTENEPQDIDYDTIVVKPAAVALHTRERNEQNEPVSSDLPTAQGNGEMSTSIACDTEEELRDEASETEEDNEGISSDLKNESKETAKVPENHEMSTSIAPAIRDDENGLIEATIQPEVDCVAKPKVVVPQEQLQSLTENESNERNENVSSESFNASTTSIGPAVFDEQKAYKELIKAETELDVECCSQAQRLKNGADELNEGNEGTSVVRVANSKEGSFKWKSVLISQSLLEEENEKTPIPMEESIEPITIESDGDDSCVAISSLKDYVAQFKASDDDLCADIENALNNLRNVGEKSQTDEEINEMETTMNDKTKCDEPKGQHTGTDDKVDEENGKRSSDQQDVDASDEMTGESVVELMADARSSISTANSPTFLHQQYEQPSQLDVNSNIKEKQMQSAEIGEAKENSPNHLEKILVSIAPVNMWNWYELFGKSLNEKSVNASQQAEKEKTSLEMEKDVNVGEMFPILQEPTKRIYYDVDSVFEATTDSVDGKTTGAVQRPFEEKIQSINATDSNFTPSNVGIQKRRYKMTATRDGSNISNTSTLGPWAEKPKVSESEVQTIPDRCDTPPDLVIDEGSQESAENNSDSANTSAETQPSIAEPSAPIRVNRRLKITPKRVLQKDDSFGCSYSDVDDEICIPNTNNKICFGTNHCALCAKTLKGFPLTFAKHYLNCHPESEVYCARLSTEAAKIATNNTPFAHFRNSIYETFCIFCGKTHTKPYREWYIHYATATGEYAGYCVKCHEKVPRNEHCGLKYRYPPDLKQKLANDIKAHVCNFCNFIQLDAARLIKHLRREHQFKGPLHDKYTSVVLLQKRKANRRKFPTTQANTSQYQGSATHPTPPWRPNSLRNERRHGATTFIPPPPFYNIPQKFAKDF